MDLESQHAHGDHEGRKVTVKDAASAPAPRARNLIVVLGAPNALDGTLSAIARSHVSSRTAN